MFCFLCGILTAFTHLLYLGWATVDFVFDFATGLVSDDRIITFVRAEIAAVAVNSIFFSGQQLSSFDVSVTSWTLAGVASTA